jgi:DNA-binding MarR family transcriptional regulator
MCKQYSMNGTPFNFSPRYQALIQLLRTAETLWNSSRILFAAWELGPSQFNVLNLLYELPEGMSQTELSRALLMHRSNVTGLVDRLEKRGLLKRQEVPGDRRSYRVELTRQGLDLMKEILPRYYQAAEEVWGNLRDDQANRMKIALEQIGANAQRMTLELTK